MYGITEMLISHINSFYTVNYHFKKYLLINIYIMEHLGVSYTFNLSKGTFLTSIPISKCKKRNCFPNYAVKIFTR